VEKHGRERGGRGKLTLLESFRLEDIDICEQTDEMYIGNEKEH
jgi:hypothetical protein